MMSQVYGRPMRVFNGQTPEGLEASASLLMRKRGRWVLIVAIGTHRNARGCVVLPPGERPCEIPMGKPGERRPSDITIGRAERLGVVAHHHHHDATGRRSRRARASSSMQAITRAGGHQVIAEFGRQGEAWKGSTIRANWNGRWITAPGRHSRTAGPGMPNKFSRLWDWAARQPKPPRWGVVPDVVADREGTIRRWHDWAPKLRTLYGWPLAFAVQDGMAASDVPSDADVVFVGGSTAWKYRTMADWCARFPRVHIARINAERRLWQCQAMGAESVDGTGWFRDNARQAQGLRTYLQRMRDGHGPNPRLISPDLFGGLSSH